MQTVCAVSKEQKTHDVMNIYQMNWPKDNIMPECSIPFFDPWSEIKLSHGIRIDTECSPPVRYELEYKYPLGDRPYCTACFLISPRFAEVVKTLTADYQEFPSEIYHKGMLCSKEYVSFVITKNYAALDFDNSVYFSQRHGMVFGLKKIVLESSQVESVIGQTDIFRLKESRFRILVTEKGRQAIEDAGIRSVVFEELEISA